jgi:hypothetical protein
MFVDIPCTKLYPNGKKHAENADKITLLAEENMAFTAPSSTKLTLAQQHYLEIFRTEFSPKSVGKYRKYG